MIDIKGALVQWFINFLIKKTSDGAAMVTNKYTIKNENILNKELAEKLPKPIIRKFEKRKVL